jgi:hypothetical protein
MSHTIMNYMQSHRNSLRSNALVRLDDFNAEWGDCGSLSARVESRKMNYNEMITFSLHLSLVNQSL